MTHCVAVIDNYDATRDSVAQAFARSAGGPAEFEVVFSGERPEPLLSAAAPHVDLVVLDLHLGRDDEDATGFIAPLVETGAAVVVHTTDERPVRLQRCLAEGAAAISLKHDGTPAVVEVSRQVLAGEFPCSSAAAEAVLKDPAAMAVIPPRHVEVLQGIADGLTQQQVARRHGLAGNTVRNYLAEIRRCYLELGRDVTNAVSLLREANRDGWIDFDR